MSPLNSPTSKTYVRECHKVIRSHVMCCRFCEWCFCNKMVPCPMGNDFINDVVSKFSSIINHISEVKIGVVVQCPLSLIAYIVHDGNMPKSIFLGQHQTTMWVLLTYKYRVKNLEYQVAKALLSTGTFFSIFKVLYAQILNPL